MRSDELGYDPSPTPKLSLFSLPGKLHESPARMLTSPIHTLASVPFKWEDAPGKPSPPCMPQSDEPKIDRCLELPPRLRPKRATCPLQQLSWMDLTCLGPGLLENEVHQ
ncbi:hypothetical protein D5086_022882 [Populus alba]|uniref:Uncharacterized protein n=3 Tax=Populus TaxID=3689 RepID=A0A4U5N8P2_POPAL|nr:hypothetical protein NC653_028740 [Populus alba x Populus x berolinensis]TKR79198.1 hypothetical protein D5086_0000275370 [Populus alba]